MVRIIVIAFFFVAVLFSENLNAQSINDFGRSTLPTSEAQVKKPIPVEKSINVYPIPAIDYIIVEIKNQEQIVSPVFELYSLIGSKIVIHPEALSQTEYKIPVDHINTSSYYYIVLKDEITGLEVAHKFLKD